MSRDLCVLGIYDMPGMVVKRERAALSFEV